MADVDDHHHHGLHVLQLTVHDAHGLLLLEEAVLLLGLELDGAPGLLLDALHQLLLFLLDEAHQLVREDELALDLGLGVVQLRRLLLDGVCDR